MLANVRYAIKDPGITNLYEEMEKAYVMEENMLESNVEFELILGRVQRKMTNLSINP